MTKHWLLVIPRLAHAIACLVIVLIATPILALLADRRRQHQGHDMTDALDMTPHENTPTENTLLEVADVLGAASVPRTTAERDGAGVDLEISLPDRIRWLASDRDDKAKEAASWESVANDIREQRARINRALRDAGAPMDELMTDQGVTWIVRELTKDRDFIAEQRRQVEADLVALTQQRDAFMRQRDEALAEVMKANDELVKYKELADHAEAWRLTVATGERTIARLTAKVKRLVVLGDASHKTKKRTSTKPKARKRS